MTLQAFQKELENLQGEYTFNFAREEDCEYLFEEYGGEKKMKNEYPQIYKSFQKARENGKMCDGEEGDFTFQADQLHLYLEEDTDGMEKGENPIVRITAPVHCDFIDSTKEVQDIAPASEWLGISIQVKIWEKNTPNYLVNFSRVIPSANRYDGVISSNPEERSDIINKDYMTEVTVTGINPDGELKRKIYRGEQSFGEVVYYTISNVHVEDPAPKSEKHKASEEIMMLYGRIDQQKQFEDADYKDGDFRENTFGDGKVHLLLPMKGVIEFDYKVEPIGFKKPDKKVAMVRPKANYDYKGQEFVYWYDLKNKENLKNDEELYLAIKDCFVKEHYEQKQKARVYFDIKIPTAGRSSWDWHTDVEGIQNGDPKTIYVTAAFVYVSKDQLGIIAEDQITIKSIEKEKLKLYKRKYYEYVPGTNIIYIPPITVYWGCFGKNVEITMVDKSQKPISKIQCGDKIISYNGQILQVEDIVTGMDDWIYSIKTRENGEIKVSGGHPMMREGKCVRACSLTAGDMLNLGDGSRAKIESITEVPYQDVVYNLTFRGIDEGTYIIANGFCAGDLRMQNQKTEVEKRVLTEEENALIAEVLHHCETVG